MLSSGSLLLRPSGAFPYYSYCLFMDLVKLNCPTEQFAAALSSVCTIAVLFSEVKLIVSHLASCFLRPACSYTHSPELVPSGGEERFSLLKKVMAGGILPFCSPQFP